MSSRADIVGASDVRDASGRVRKYGLIYTRRCGWIDLGHANPQGASKLWSQVLAKTGNACLVKPKDVVISYQQTMKRYGVTDGEYRVYQVQQDLTPEEQKSVALAIFMEVSIAFEGMQSNWLYRKLTDSGFSVEDLVSNLIGFYRALHPAKDYITPCQPVSKGEALEVWDTYGSVGSNKNHKFSPVLFPSTRMCELPREPKLPAELDTIVPAVAGKLFRRI